ncbi:MAG: C40 family peptidase, partial [Flavobacteriales bacterium]|nr:C40 family peptidase [Flavobacteriales bacterium]
MEYGVSVISVIPLREEPSDKAQMVSQILFGETYKILESRKKWSRIRCSFDSYEGWIDNKQVFKLTKDDFDACEKDPNIKACVDVVSLIQEENENDLIAITSGSTLHNFENKKFSLGERSFEFHGNVNDVTENVRDRLLNYAMMYKNSPYLWGGRSPFGIDCSGFTQVVYKLCGIKLPRDAYQQAEMGQTLSFIEEAEQGDLAFFDDNEGNITHVGIILND